MKMEVDVDAGFVARLARAGYELTGDFRVPRLGEYLVDPDSDSVIPAVNIVSGCRWIVRKAWEWPSDILGPNVWGLAMNENGRSYAYFSPQRVGQISWIPATEDGNEAHPVRLNRFNCAALGFTIPQFTDWRTPILNPNYQPAAKYSPDAAN